MDGTEFPYIIKIEYVVGGKTYKIRKWFNAGIPLHNAGDIVQVVYDPLKPAKAKMLYIRTINFGISEGFH